MTFRVIDDELATTLIRRWLAGESLRRIARESGVDRKTLRRYVQCARTARVANDTEPETLAAIAHIVRRPSRRVSHVEHMLRMRAKEIATSLFARTTLAEVHRRLLAAGIPVSYSTLRRFAIRELRWSPRRSRRPAPSFDVVARERSA